jgi:hypothetical protein
MIRVSSSTVLKLSLFETSIRSIIEEVNQGTNRYTQGGTGKAAEDDKVK